jgi:peptidoglycan DL-endopeptidase CwlO
MLAEQRAEDARLAQERAAAAAAAAQQAAAAAAQAAAQQAAQEVAQQQQADQARQAAAVQANVSVTTVPVTVAPVTTVPVTTVPAESSSAPSLPATSSAAAIAVQAAESRVGDPYVWGGAGPDDFDCSGLVMWAYEQAGISLPHYSGAQFADTTQIPMSDLEPGDLVFPADPGEHVAMYVGGGMIVQAPYTGADVQIVPLSGFFVLATRVE